MCGGGGKKTQTKAKKTKLAKSKTTVNPVLPCKKKCYLKVYVLRSDTGKALPEHRTCRPSRCKANERSF